MSSMAVRTGAAVSPTITTSGTDNSLTAPRLVTFASPVRPCVLQVPLTFGGSVVVKVNAPVTNDFDNDADDDGVGYFQVAAGTSQDLSFEGRVSIETVTFATTAADDLDAVRVVGWPGVSPA